MTQAEALTILKTGANVFLTGEPGAGKTYTINQYVRYLRERGVEPSITASTGIAATHIGGRTIHSWSGLGIAARLDKYLIDKVAGNERVVKRLEKARVLIIDEVSMLGPGTLSMVDAVCRDIRRSPEPFGGLQVILVGDFFQLPPIKKIDSGPEDPKKPPQLFTNKIENFAYDSPAWNRFKPVICYLTEQHRQDDPHFLELLSAIRANDFRDKYLTQIKSRATEYLVAPAHAPKLYTHNLDVDIVNSEMLAKLPGRTETFLMHCSGREGLILALKKGCLSPEKLELKIGASVMFTKNNFEAGYVNGTLGVVDRFTTGLKLPVIKTRAGKWIEVENAEWKLEEDGRVIATLGQLPLRLAWAITVHKSQGMSMDEAVMDLSQVFEYGQGYVALSRVRRLEGVYLLGWNSQAFMIHPDVLAKDSEFRASSTSVSEVFEKLSPEEINTMQVNFIKACGGAFKKAGEVKKTNKKRG